MANQWLGWVWFYHAVLRTFNPPQSTQQHQSPSKPLIHISFKIGRLLPGQAVLMNLTYAYSKISS